MKLLTCIAVLLAFQFCAAVQAQDTLQPAAIANSSTVSIEINGDCGMCEKTIERAGTVEGESALDWDVDTHVAVITYDSTRTDLDAILLRVAKAGYDNERYPAPNEAYDGLPGCCQYERKALRKEEPNE